MGFYPTALRNELVDQQFTRKTFSRCDLAPSRCSSSFPVVTRCGGSKQGQNRDKSACYKSDNCRPLTFSYLIVVLGAVAGGVNRSDERVETKIVKRRRRRPEERGLPDRHVLIDLARTYLEEQAKLWPELKKAKIIPARTPQVLEAMAKAFEQRFLTGTTVYVSAPVIGRRPMALVASYLRYSDANSNSRSLAQQLKLQLRKARDDLGVDISYPTVLSAYGFAHPDIAQKALERETERGQSDCNP